MTKFVKVLIHFGIGALQIAAAASDYVPGKYKPLAVAIGGLAHVILGYINHTPAV